MANIVYNNKDDFYRTSTILVITFYLKGDSQNFLFCIIGNNYLKS